MCGRKHAVQRGSVGFVAGTEVAGGGGGSAMVSGRGACGWAAGMVEADAARLPPRQQVERAGRVLAPAVAGSLFIFSVVPSASWIVFAFGWMLFPAVGLLASGVAGVAREAAPELRAGLRAWLEPATSGSDVPPVVRSLRLNAERLPQPEARVAARAVATAAERLGAAARQDPDRETLAWVTERYLDPTATLLKRYADLVAAAGPEGPPVLGEFAADGLPAIAAKLDQVREELGPTPERRAPLA